MKSTRANTKYVFVTGGVLSGLGKGITAASVAAILQARGLKVSIQKLDPYLNVDAGTLNPAEHGECFVTEDGAETDLDLGHYERFLDINLSKKSSVMSGRLLRQMIDDERAGKYLGKTVQLVPHLTNAIQAAVIEAGKDSDVHIAEVGGTVGDYEGLAFIEALREMPIVVGRENCAYAHVVYVPYLGASKEFKSKPAQNAVRELRGLGIVPDLLLVRSEEPTKPVIIEKIGLFGGLDQRAVVGLPNAKSVYQVPLTLEAHRVAEMLLDKFGIKTNQQPELSKWYSLVERATTTYKKSVRIGVIAKYLDNEDTYFSVVEALKSAAWMQGVALELAWVDAENLQDNIKQLDIYDGIIVPGGFGNRGVEGKIAAAQYAADHDIPYLGLCLGLQVAVIAAARSVGLSSANSSEFDAQTLENVVYIMPDQVGKESTGGSMRLGAYTCELKPRSLVAQLYGTETISERHRHRYEVNNNFINEIKRGGVAIVGTSPGGTLVEMIERPENRFFVATQAHPEFKSRPFKPHPLFEGLIKAAKTNE